MATQIQAQLEPVAGVEEAATNSEKFEENGDGDETHAEHQEAGSQEMAKLDEMSRVEAMMRNLVNINKQEETSKAKLEVRESSQNLESKEEEQREILHSAPKSVVTEAGDEHSLPQNEKKRALDPSSLPAQDSRKKRGRKPSPGGAKLEEDDVCFVCFDGGDLVLCDQRSCPKAYHLQCIGRDEDFFQKKGNWLCGWHFCCGCSKKASVRCFTCPKAYCLGCRKKASFLLIEKKKGLCDECVPIVKMIERNESVNADGNAVDFNDRETYEGLFKEYWDDLKAKLSILVPEFDKDGNVLNGSMVEPDDENETSSSESEVVAEVDIDDEGGRTRDRKTRGLSSLIDDVKCTINQEQKVDDEEEDMGEEEEDEEEEEEEPLEDEADDQRQIEYDGWASKELREFVEAMGEDPLKPQNRTSVNKLLWQHIKAHNLQNPRRKSIIRCDDMLQALFARKTVNHQSLMKHIQVHFAPKQTKKMDQFKELDEKSKLKRKQEAQKPAGHEYAAINPANINLVYLKRNLLEDLLGDPEFEQKVVGTYVRIRVPGMTSKSEMCYRLVQITGIKTHADEYKCGKKSTNVVLQIMNLNKKEDVTVDLVSNQDFTTEECKRLRQSIRCGFIQAPTVADFEKKNLAIREAKLNDWFESETGRLGALRDRANEQGRKKELRECVEKLKQLADPTYRAKELAKVPSFEVDPKMDPAYESEPEEPKSEEKPAKKQKGSPPAKKPKRSDVSPGAFSRRDSFKKENPWEPDYGQQFRQPQLEQRQQLPPPPPLPAPLPARPAPMMPPAAASTEMPEMERAWFYMDPTGTVQGPFTMEQLRKWDTTGVFPADLRVWRTNQTREQSVLLKEVLAWGTSPRALPPPPSLPPPPPLHQQHQAQTYPGQQQQWESRPMMEQQRPYDSWSQPSPRTPQMASYQESSPNGNSWGGEGASWGYERGGKAGNNWSSGSTGGGGGGGWGQQRGGFTQPKKSVPCRFYQKGYCRNGENCPFQH